MSSRTFVRRAVWKCLPSHLRRISCWKEFAPNSTVAKESHSSVRRCPEVTFGTGDCAIHDSVGFRDFVIFRGSFSQAKEYTIHKITRKNAKSEFLLKRWPSSKRT